MLLILCPDIMLKVALQKEKTKEVATKEKFMNNLNKALKVPHFLQACTNMSKPSEALMVGGE